MTNLITHGRGHLCWRCFRLNSVDFTYFARPADTLPDTEIDKHPSNSEGDSQRDPDLSRLLQTIRQLVHVTSAGKECGTFTTTNVHAH